MYYSYDGLERFLSVKGMTNLACNRAWHFIQDDG